MIYMIVINLCNVQLSHNAESDGKIKEKFWIEHPKLN